jgi:hypothetical protein
MNISSFTAAATKAAAALADLRTDRPLSVDTSGAICIIYNRKLLYVPPNANFEGLSREVD